MATLQLMQCGHAANAIDFDGNPVCAICLGINTGADVPFHGEVRLTGRTARCVNCGKEAPSDAKLPFFDYCGPGSRYDYVICSCKYNESAHARKAAGEPGMSSHICDDFTPTASAARETDAWYCGCMGWD